MSQRTRLLPREAYHRDARLFVIAVEGTVEEPWYFKGLYNHGLVPRKRVKLEVLPSEEGRSSPKHVAKRLQDFCSSHALIPADHRWLVMDVDRHKNLNDTLQLAHEEGWNFSISNPCFEIWLQYQFLVEPQGTTSADAKSHWASLRKDRSEPWPFDGVSVRCACDRATTASAEWIPPAPGSTVGQVVRALLHAA